ncbi:aminotransferase class V-fold PLP-dependent enzyme [Alicyclobacillus ferrooxydans]|nr:aminotransferase class V-fold PLP-dependent enzyme [Alicyclobacillus ferrooxydans]
MKTKRSLLHEYRSLFPILEEKIHLGNCSQSPQSTPVLAAIDEYLSNWRSVGMDWDFWMEGVEQAKASFARLINADPSEVAVAGSVSDAASMIASAFPLGNQRHVVTTVDEFPTVGQVWNAHARRGWLDVDFVSAADRIYTPSVFEPHITSQTGVLSVHHVGYYNGAKQDLNELASLAHEHHALLFVDAYQSMGTCVIDVQKTPIDILVSGNLKYLLGMPGIAFLYVRKEVAERLEPAMTGWFGRQNPFHFDAKNLDYAASAGRFNTGTPPVLAAFAARGGMDLIFDVGLERIERRIDELSAYAVQGVQARGLDLASPEDITLKGANTAIRVSNAHDVEVFLMEKSIIASARGDVIRLAPHFFSTEAELDRALDAICERNGQHRAH